MEASGKSWFFCEAPNDNDGKREKWKSEGGEKMVVVTHCYDINCSTTGTILKNKDEIMKHEVCADNVYNNIKEMWESDRRDGETGSASASSPAQLNADSRES